MTSSRILHLVPSAEFRALADSAPYRPRQFDADGFIHCTVEADVLLGIANNFYKNVPGEFIVLVIDPARVTAPVKFEPPIPPPPPGSPLAAHLFPHIYGSLNREAIVETRTAVRAEDGTFLSLGF